MHNLFLQKVRTLRKSMLLKCSKISSGENHEITLQLSQGEQRFCEDGCVPSVPDLMCMQGCWWIVAWTLAREYRNHSINHCMNKKMSDNWRFEKIVLNYIHIISIYNIQIYTHTLVLNYMCVCMCVCVYI